MEQVTDLANQAIFLKSFIALFVVVILLFCVRYVLKRFYGKALQHDHGKMTRILDVCPLEGDRKLLLFACPFSQGLILMSPKGDQVVLFDGNKNENTIP